MKMSEATSPRPCHSCSISRFGFVAPSTCSKYWIIGCQRNTYTFQVVPYWTRGQVGVEMKATSTSRKKEATLSCLISIQPFCIEDARFFARLDSWVSRQHLGQSSEILLLLLLNWWGTQCIVCVCVNFWVYLYIELQAITWGMFPGEWKRPSWVHGCFLWSSQRSD